MFLQQKEQQGSSMATIYQNPHLWVDIELGRGFCHPVTITTLSSLCVGIVLINYQIVRWDVGEWKMDEYRKLRTEGSHRRPSQIPKHQHCLPHSLVSSLTGLDHREALV